VSFPHLHVASERSAGWGTAPVGALVAKAVEQGATVVALTDRDSLDGAFAHIRACISAGVDPLLGVDFALLSEPDAGEASAARVTVLAHGHNDGEGWAALCRLTSASRSVQRREAGIDLALAAEHLAASGISVATVLLGPDSDVGRAAASGELALATQLLTGWSSRLPGGVAVELVCHPGGAHPGGAQPGEVHPGGAHPGEIDDVEGAARMLGLARAVGVPAVLSNAVRHLSAEEASVPDPRETGGLDVFSMPSHRHAWLKPLDEMRELARAVVACAELPPSAADELLAGTAELADACRLHIEHDLAFGSDKSPEHTVLGTSGELGELAWQRTHAAFDKRYGHLDPTERQALQRMLRDELLNLERDRATARWLAAAEVVEVVRELGMRWHVSASAAGSLVGYLLDISEIDPVAAGWPADPVAPGGATTSGAPTAGSIELDVESHRLDELHLALGARFGEHRIALFGADEPLGVVIGSGALLDQLPVGYRRSGRHGGPGGHGGHGGHGLPSTRFDRAELDEAGFLTVGLRGSRAQDRIAFALAEAERLEGGRPVMPFDGAVPEGSAPADSVPELQWAWLEQNRPTAFLAALLTHPDDGAAPLSAESAKTSRLLPLDVNASAAVYRAEAGGVRRALSEVPRSGESELRRIVAAQPFLGLDDFVARAAPSRALALRLALAGALDSLFAGSGDAGPTRGEVVARVREAVAGRAREQLPSEGDDPRLLPLFTDGEEIPEPVTPVAPPEASPATAASAAPHEPEPAYRSVVDEYRPLLDELGVVPAGDLFAYSSGQTVFVAGIRIAPRATIGALPGALVSLDDGSGCSDVAFAEEAKAQVRIPLFGTRFMIVQGTVQFGDDGEVSLDGIDAWDLKQLWAQWNDSRRGAAGSAGRGSRKRAARAG
jgi:DNA polymerase III alpha subunit